VIGRPDPVAALARQARRRLWAARLALAWERLWPALWPAVGIAGLFLVLALFDLVALVPGWLHAIVLAGFAAAFVVALARARGALTLADEAAARRRIERASGLRHRPLSALDDRPVAADPRSKALWTRHLWRLAAAAGRLRVGLPAPGLARSDPYGLRAVLLLFLVIAFTAAGGDGGRRVARAFQPDLSGLGGGGPVELTMWLTPPAYTGAAPLYLAAGAAAVAGTAKTTEITLPGGSEVVARVHGGRGLPELRIDDRAIPFEAIDDTNFELRATIADGKRLAVTQAGETVADWPMTVIQDQPPRIEYAKPPGRTRRSALRLDYLAEDDYGLTSAKAEIRLAEGGDDSVLGFDLPLPGDGRDAVQGTSYNDLTPHPWAGLPVTITLSATDALGQVGRSETIAIVLPERIFNHPVARAIIELRKTLTRDPGKRAEVARGLAELARRPGQFFDDVTVFLGLRAAYWRLVYGRSATVVGEMQSLLWDLALTIEEGPLALAEQDLRAAQQALMEALDGDAPDEEINRLVDELRAALENYLDALREIAASKRDRDPSLEERMAETI